MTNSRRPPCKCSAAHSIPDRDDLNYTWLPIVLACVVAYFIAGCFLGLYELIIDAIFMCFVEDCDKNNGVDSPYFMSKGLMEFVKNADEAKKAEEKRQKKDQQTAGETSQSIEK